ncbi:peptidoglycan-binding domain-containing protein [Pleomorphomonas koreensis]|uniref:peptidoglycan-binding domain-containing protein n=1 Tax=Pleomorphomonas koreensis TaxID=257440 RepID=UPI0012EB2CA0
MHVAPGGTRPASRSHWAPDGPPAPASQDYPNRSWPDHLTVYTHLPRGANVSSGGAVWAALATFCILLQSPADAQEWNRSPRQVQQALTDFGFKPGAADGVWGKKSASALRAFQKAQGLTETGFLDEATSAKLFAPNRKLVDDVVKALASPNAASGINASGPPKSDPSWRTEASTSRSDPVVVGVPLPPASPPSELSQPSNSTSDGNSQRTGGATEDRVPGRGVASALAVPSGQSRERVSLPLAG